MKLRQLLNFPVYSSNMIQVFRLCADLRIVESNPQPFVRYHHLDRPRRSRWPGGVATHLSGHEHQLIVTHSVSFEIMKQHYVHDASHARLRTLHNIRIMIVQDARKA